MPSKSSVLTPIFIAEFALFFSLFMTLYIYLGYPLIAWLLSLIFKRGITKGEDEPYVSILIAAYNEENDIRRTVENKLEQDYPKEKMEIIVVSDGSTDKTDEIVSQYRHRGVRLIRQALRSGKTLALNRGVQEAKGEIIVFSDANSNYKEDAIKKIVRNFKDPMIGYVTGKMIYTRADGTAAGDGCSKYMQYENILRNIETNIGSLVGVDGGIDAVKKDLYRNMRQDQLPDFVLPLRVVENGYRVVYEPEAIMQEPSLIDMADEYGMRVRVSLRALWAISDMRKLLSIKRYGLFAWQLWSHKVLRYFGFVFLTAAYLGNLILFCKSSIYTYLFMLQTIFYFTAIISMLCERMGFSFRMFRMPSYFLLLNIASCHAFIKFVLGQKKVMWEPRKG